MIVSLEVKCTICKRVFCCKRCRLNHEDSHHAAEIELRKACHICNGEPLIFNSENYTADMMAHIFQHHAPLYCKKCNKVFSVLDDIQNSAKCFHTESVCIVTTAVTPPLTDVFKVPFSPNDYTSPSSSSNLSKHKERSITDLSSIRNYSSINLSSLNNRTNPTSNLVRTTSTPIINQLLIKIKETTFSTSSCRYSAIYNQSSSTESTSPIEPLQRAPADTTQPGAMVRSRSQTSLSPRRMTGRKMPVSATPLRQVMSKSIQRAIIVQSMGNSAEEMSFKSNYTKPPIMASGTPALDLRTTPVLRRAKSDGFALVQSASKFCEKLEDSSSPSPDSIKSQYSTAPQIHDSDNNTDLMLTPKSEPARAKLVKQPPTELSDTESDSDAEPDVWKTPMSHSRSAQCLPTTPLKHEQRTPDKTTSDGGGNSKLFALVSSVMQFASLAGTTAKSSGGSLIRRAASFTGYSKKPDSIPYHNPIKRRRALTQRDPGSSSGSSGGSGKFVLQFSSCSSSPLAKRPKRIQGRPPINRTQSELSS